MPALWRVFNVVLLGLSSTLIFVEGYILESNHHGRQSSSMTLRNSEYTFTCTTDGFFGNDKNCSIFHRCVEVIGQSKNDTKIFKRYDYDCPPGTIFDTKIDNCNYPWEARPIGGCSATNSSQEIMTTSTTIRPRPQTPPQRQAYVFYYPAKNACLQRCGVDHDELVSYVRKCDGKEHQDWYVRKIGVTSGGLDRVFRVLIEDVEGKKCLGANENNDVYLRICRNDANQIWRLSKTQIINEVSNACLVRVRNGLGGEEVAYSGTTKFYCNMKWEFRIKS